MKDRGLGTPATRAAIIETLLDRGFIERKGRALVTTQNGRALIRGLKKIDPTAVSAKQTAEMEYELKKMERGNSSYTRGTFLDAVLKQFLDVAEQYKASSTRLGEAERPELVDGTPTGSCPKSGKPILDRGAAQEAHGFDGTLLWKECFDRWKWMPGFPRVARSVSPGLAQEIRRPRLAQRADLLGDARHRRRHARSPSSSPRRRRGEEREMP